MTRRMLGFPRAWEREEDDILVSSRSGCPVKSHENLRWEVCKLPFLQLNISFHESWMSQPFVFFALALLQIGKCQSFLDKQKLLIVELIWMSSKTFSTPMRTPCPTLSDLRWTIKWPTMINDPDWSVEIWMLFLTARLITINNSYLARAAHCPDKSSQLMGSPIKCSSHWCRDCSEYAGSHLNTHHPKCLNTATDNVLCHS